MNDGTGRFTAPLLQVAKPGSWLDLDGNLVDQPTGYSSDWSKATQVVAIGPLNSGFNAQENSWGGLVKQTTALLAVEDGQLWLYRAKSSSTFNAPAIKVSNATNWDDYDLIGPGPLGGNDKQPQVWARERSTGRLLSFPITLRTVPATGVTVPDLGRLAAPGNGIALNGFFPVASYPTVSSAGDLNGDKAPDLWALDGQRRLLYWTGEVDAADPNKMTGLKLASGASETRAPATRLRLDEIPVGGTAVGGATIVNGDINGATDYLQLDGDAGRHSQLQTRVQVDTGKSFTLDVWTKVAGGTEQQAGAVLSQDGVGTSNFMVWPDSDNNRAKAVWRFGMARGDDATGWPYDITILTNSAALVVPDVWTKLTASYNAATGEMALYVNGTLAGSGRHTAKTAPTGTVVFGRYRNAGQEQNYYRGAVSDFSVYTSPTVPGSVAGTVTSGVNSGVCLDNSEAQPVDGNPIHVWTCSPIGQFNVAQHWVANTDDGSLRVQGKCMDVINAQAFDGNQVQLLTCKGLGGNGAQQWLVRADGSLYNPLTDRCLDLSGFDTGSGTRPTIWHCISGQANQVWSTTAVA
ncbi:ricin-type beta-trefoil lectin domain protein [Kitasatospora sp. NPDC051853]|uniref:ricin-type beta-trefoil lectin domain protein n=1 Tax=Kitasatospora sp. NPDC051853 TaxID=3364058 RepID=UPI0037AB04D0